MKWLSFDMDASKWFISLNALILDDPDWEIISQGKSPCNIFFFIWAVSKCQTFWSNLEQWSSKDKNMCLIMINITNW